jgi:hypothetical protein
VYPSVTFGILPLENTEINDYSALQDINQGGEPAAILSAKAVGAPFIGWLSTGAKYA